MLNEFINFINVLSCILNTGEACSIIMLLDSVESYTVYTPAVIILLIPGNVTVIIQVNVLYIGDMTDGC